MGVQVGSTRRDFSRIVLGATLLTPFALGGCGILPAAGPLGMDVLAGQRDPQSLPYALVRVVTEVLAKAMPRLTASRTEAGRGLFASASATS